MIETDHVEEWIQIMAVGVWKESSKNERGNKRNKEMTLMDKKGSQGRLAKITRHKRSEKGKLGAWIAKDKKYNMKEE